MSDEISEAVEFGKHRVPEIQVHVPVEEEESNLSAQPESSVHSPVDVGEAEQIAIAQLHDLANQESSSMQVEFSDQDDGVLVSRPGSEECDSEDAKVAEDAGKEDMFVDAPDELIAYDGRNTDSGKHMALAAGNQESLEETSNIRESQFHELDYGRQVHHHSIDEVESLRAMLEKTVDEKEVLAQQNKQERDQFAKELANLRHQLKALSDQESLIGENDGGLVDRLQRAETGDMEATIHASETETPLWEMINECSDSLKSALEERLQTEATVRELHAILYVKDKEIEDLNAKVTELSLSRDVVGSYLNSLWSQSLEVSSDSQLKKEQHIEAVINRTLALFGSVIEQDESSDDSVAGMISHVEKSVTVLMANYNKFLSEIDQLRQSLTEAGLDQEFETVFAAARYELLELRRKQAEFVGKLSHLESENYLLVEQLDKEKGMAKSMNLEFGKMKMELEQEKAKSANTKEKLGMAVTKGKALVQQRDSLRQSLAEKTSELEKCLVELQEKSSALEGAELIKEDLAKSENMVAALQEALSQRDMIIEKIDYILSQTSIPSIPEGLQSMDCTEKIRRLVDEKAALDDAYREFQKVNDAISLIDLPEAVSSLDLESKVNLFRESFYHAKDEIMKLQDYLASTEETAHNEIDRLTASLSAEIQEKSYLQMELDDLACKYEGIVQKEHRLSLEMDQVVRMLLEASGSTQNDQEGASQHSVDLPMLINRCLEKVKEQSSASSEASHVEAEMFERILALLYVRDQELMLCGDILEEEILERSKVNNLWDELRVATKELSTLKHEKDSLQKDFERSEEKSALLREKLSMAVKKGKGLVQDRENLKGLLDEKNKEIENLKLELQKQESILGEYKDQNSRLSTDVERIPKLEMDLVDLNEQRDQLEKFLVESNNMLQKVIESIDGIALPVDLVFKEPVDKVKWIAGFCNECEAAKTHAEQELGKVRDEASSFATKLEEANTTIKSMEDALSVAENNISRFAEEKRELEAAKIHIKQELHKAIEEAHTQTSRSAEVSATRNSLEDALSVAENNISALINEKEDACVGRAAAEAELEKVQEEVAIQTSKLTEAYKTTKTLEETLSQVESEVALLTEDNNNAEAVRIELENEVKQLKDALSSQAGNLADATITIQSLEEALLKSENTISVLVHEKEVVEGEILTLNSKLSACLEELSGTHGSLESRSLELVGHLKDLRGLMNDGTLLYLLRKSFEKHFEKLKEMDVVLKDIRDHFVEVGSEGLQILPIKFQEDSFATKLFSDSLDNLVNLEDNGEINAADGDNISSQFSKIVEGFHSRSKFLGDKFEDLSNNLDQYTATLLGKFQATRDDFMVLIEQLGSLKQEVKNIEMYKHAQEDTIATLENHVASLVSACTDATKELQFEIENKLVEPTSVPGLELDHSLIPEARKVDVYAAASGRQSPEDGKYVETIEKLLLATRKVHTLIKQFDDKSNLSVLAMEDMQNNLNETRKSLEKAIEERHISQNRVSELETDIEGLHNLCSELRLEVQDSKANEAKLKEREAEVSSLYNTLLEKGHEKEEHPLSASQLRTLFEKTSDIKISFAQSEVEDLEPQSSANVEKLFRVIDTVTELQHQLKLLTHDKEELQSTLATQVLEIQHLKEEVEKHTTNSQDLEKLKNELPEIMLGLENIILKLGGSDVVGDQNPAGMKGLLPILEKFVMALILDCENSKSKVHELGSKLLGSQKVVEDLSNKVKSLEESLQSRTAPEIVQERSIFEPPSLPTGSEISEIEDVGPLAKNVISPVPSAAQMRTMRKGSTDHLVLDIDTESDRLINTEETDEDKGHVFKSLNTSGIIPIQGKMIADRIDGIWVSGGRLLMSRPRARLGLIAYWLLLHIWLLGSIL